MSLTIPYLLIFRRFFAQIRIGIRIVLCTFVFTVYCVWQTSAQRLPGRVVPTQVQTADSLLSRLPSARDTARVEILDSLAWIYRGTDFGQAMKYAQQAAKEVAVLGYPSVRAQNNNYLGVIYRNLGSYAKAMEYFVEARRIAEEYGYRREEVYALNNIGEIYKYQRRYDDARMFVMLAVNIFDQLRDSTGLYYCHIRLGEIAQSLNDYPAALLSFRQALAYSEAFGDKVWKAGALNRIGQVYRQQGFYAEALEAFFPALAISESAMNDEDEQALILIHIGQTHLASQRQDSAAHYLRRGFELATRIGLRQHIREASKTLAEIYTAKKDYALALHFQTIQMAMNDSLFSEAGRREIERISAKYDMEKQQLALDALSAEQKQERFIGLVLALGVVLLLVSAGLLYRNIRSERRANAEILRQQRILEDQSTEIEMTNTTLQEQNKELEALNTEKIELMGIVAHDLKNPIGAVRGLAELVESDAVEGNDLREAVRQIILTSDRMLALVTNILDSNRLELGGMKFSIVEFDILPVIEATCWQYTQAAESKQITIHFLPEIPSALVLADEQAVMQIMDNLLSNAVKYSPPGKNIFIRITNGTVETASKQVPQASSIRLAVQDEGPGLSDDDKTKLFSKFARLSARPTGGEHSTGLGLSIVKKMVEALNGRVWCESELGKGAIFIVELPATQH
jgi:signal transduction histidine kinase